MAKIKPVLELHLLRFGERVRGPRNRSRGRPREKGVVVPFRVLSLRPADKVILLDLLSRQVRGAEIVECCLSEIASTTGYCPSTVRESLRSLFRQELIICRELEGTSTEEPELAADLRSGEVESLSQTAIVSTEESQVLPCHQQESRESSGDFQELADDGGNMFLAELLKGGRECE